MTRRNAFTLFEIVFWPIVNLLSVGSDHLSQGGASTVVFVLVGTFALSTVQVCQLDVAYAPLFDMWSKSVKHQLVAPIRPWHLVLGSWLMGLCGDSGVHASGGGDPLGVRCERAREWSGARRRIAGRTPPLGGGLGLLVCTLLMVFGLRAEVSAWSG
jgi:ABC-2 type transport system permease protein